MLLIIIRAGRGSKNSRSFGAFGSNFDRRGRQGKQRSVETAEGRGWTRTNARGSGRGFQTFCRAAALGVPRRSTGISDPLASWAVFLSIAEAEESAELASTADVRRKSNASCGIPASLAYLGATFYQLCPCAHGGRALLAPVIRLPQGSFSPSPHVFAPPYPPTSLGSAGNRLRADGRRLRGIAVSPLPANRSLGRAVSHLAEGRGGDGCHGCPAGHRIPCCDGHAAGDPRQSHRAARDD